MYHYTHGLMEGCLKMLSLPAKEEQVNELSLYADLLYEGLSKARLTGETSLKSIIEKQIFDSLYLCKLIRPCREKLIDLGTGGGLPGIPLKILMPDCYLILLDSNRKKTQFLEEAVIKLGLKKVEIINDRAEVVGHTPGMREQFDLLVSKAVAKMNVLLELSLPLIRPGGKAYLYKGPLGEEEAREAENVLEMLGGAISNQWNYTLPGGETRLIYEIIKIGSTPEIYPRRTGIPAKRPLK